MGETQIQEGNMPPDQPDAEIQRVRSEVDRLRGALRMIEIAPEHASDYAKAAADARPQLGSRVERANG